MVKEESRLHRVLREALLLGLLVVQSVVTPLPSQPVMLAAGFVYGPWLGFAISWLGVLIGAVACFGIARLLGMDVTDPTSGFQAMNRRVLEFYCGDFFPSDFPDVDVLLAAHRQGFRILEVPVRMSEGLRESSLHSGLRTLYYPYKMLLSLWAVPARRKKETHPGETR